MKRYRSATGSVLLNTLAMIVVGGVLAASMTQMTITGYRGTRNNQFSTEAFYLAESGLEAARLYLVKNECPTTSMVTPQSSGTITVGGSARGEYTYDVDYSAGPPMTWSVTAVGYAPSSTAPQGQRSITQNFTDCMSAINPIVADSPEDLILGPSVWVCNPDVYTDCNSYKDKASEGSGNSVTEYADNVSKTYSWPTFPTFPTWDTATECTASLPTSDPYIFNSGSKYCSVFSFGGNNQTINFSGSGQFHLNGINVDKTGATLNLSAGDVAGGDFAYIKTLTIDKGTTVNMLAGDYFFDSMVINQNTSFNVSGGEVRILVRDIYVNSNVTFNYTGSTPGDPTNLSMYIYDNGAVEEMTTEANFQFSGIIMAQPGTYLNFNNGNTDIRGAILSQGTVEIGTNLTLMFDDAAKAAAIEEMGLDVAIVMTPDKWRSAY